MHTTHVCEFVELVRVDDSVWHRKQGARAVLVDLVNRPQSARNESKFHDLYFCFIVQVRRFLFLLNSRRFCGSLEKSKKQNSSFDIGLCLTTLTEKPDGKSR